jgi:hypothetical protein
LFFIYSGLYLKQPRAPNMPDGVFKTLCVVGDVVKVPYGLARLCSTMVSNRLEVINSTNQREYMLQTTY